MRSNSTFYVLNVNIKKMEFKKGNSFRPIFNTRDGLNRLLAAVGLPLIRGKLISNVKFGFILALLFFVSFVEGQEFSRQSLTSSEMVRVLNREERYNLRLGGIKLQIDSALQGEMNDNINLSSSKGALSDLIFRPGVEVKGGWQATESNKITGTLGISYAKYLAHPEYDSKMPLIAPNSETDFVLSIGDWRVKLFDRFRMQEDPTSNGQLSSVALFRRFENDMGTSTKKIIKN